MQTARISPVPHSTGSTNAQMPAGRSRRKLQQRLILAGSILAVTVVSERGAAAATKSWTVPGSGNLWSSAVNWAGGVAPVNGDFLVFGTTTHLTSVNNIANLTLAGINFPVTSGGFTMNQQAAVPFLVLAGPISADALAAGAAANTLETFNTMVLNLSGTQTFTTDGVALAGTKSHNIEVKTAIAEAVAGSGILKLGAGQLTLDAANTFTGAIIVGNGTLSIPTFNDAGIAGPLGASTATIQLGTGTTAGDLKYTGTNVATSTRSFLFGSTTAGENGGAQFEATAGQITFSAPNLNVVSGVTTARTLTLQGTSTTGGIIQGVIANNAIDTGTSGSTSGSIALTKADGGTWLLSNPNNSFSGLVAINQGTVQVTSLADKGQNSSLGTGLVTSAIRIGNLTTNGTLAFVGTSGSTTNRTVTLGNGAGTGGALLQNDGGGSLIFTAPTFLATSAATVGRTLTLQGSNTTSAEIQGAIADLSPANTALTAVTKNGVGTWTLSGTGNSYSGNTTLTQGTLRLGNSEVLPDGVGRGNVVINVATGNSVTLDLSGHNETVNGLDNSTSAGTALIDNSSATPASLTVGNNGAAVNFSGNITSTGAGKLTLTKTGAGTAVFSGTTLSYGGATNLAGGTVNFTGATTTLTTSSLNLSGASTVNFGGTGSTLNATAISVGSLSTLSITGATAGLTVGAVTVAGGGTANFNNGVGQGLINGAGLLSLGVGTGTTNLGLDLGTTSNYDFLNTSGAAVAQGTIALNFTALTGLAQGTYDLLRATGGGLLTGGATYVIPSTFSGFSVATNITDTVVEITLSQNTAQPTLFWLAGSSSFATATNFSTDRAGTSISPTPPDSTSTVFFSADTNTTAAQVVTLDGSASINGIEFFTTKSDAVTAFGGTTINQGTGGTLTLGAAGIIVDSGAPAELINAPVSIGAAQTWNVVNASGLLTVAGALSGGNPLTKGGAGTLVLTGANSSFTGGLSVAAGTVSATANASALGSGTVTLGSGASSSATLLGDAQTFTNNIVLGSTTGQVTIGSTAVAATTTFSGNISGTHDLVLDSGSGSTGGLTLSGASVNNVGTITNSNAGTGLNTVSGLGSGVTSIIQNSATSNSAIGASPNLASTTTILIRNGQLSLTAATSLGAATAITLGDVNTIAPTTLRLTATLTGTPTVTVGNGDPANVGVATIVGALTGAVFPGGIVLNNHDVTVKKGTASIGAFTITGGITGTGNVLMDNTSTVNANFNISGLVNNTGTFTYNNTGTNTSGGQLTGGIGTNVTQIIDNATVASNVNISGPITVGSGGLIFTNNSNGASSLLTPSTEALTGTGNVTLSNTGNGTINLNGTVNSTGQIINSGSGTNTNTIGGVIGATAAPSLIVQNSANSILVVSGANTAYANGFLVKAGTLSGSSVATAFGTGIVTLGDNTAVNSSAATVLGAGFKFTNSVVLSDRSTATGVLSIGASTTTAANFSGGVTGNNDLNFTGASSTFPLTISGAVNNTGTVTNSSLGTVTISSALGSNVTSVTQNSSGTLVLSGNNSALTGGVTVNNGIAKITTANSLGAATAPVTLNGGALEPSTSITTTRTFRLGAAGAISVDAGQVYTLDTASSVIDATATPGVLNVTGPGTLVLNGTNTYSGGTVLSAGTTRINSVSSLGIGPATLSGGTLEATASISTARSFILSGTANTITVDSGSTYNITGAISDNGTTAGALIVNGPGTLALSGTNIYSGGTRITAGVVQINSASSLGANSGTATIAGGTVEAVADIATTRNFTLSGASNALSVDSGKTYSISGAISDGTSAGTLLANGSGTLVLTGTNGYTGGTVISGGGKVKVNSASALGAAAGVATINDGTLDATATFSTSRNFLLGAATSAISVDSGASYLISGTVNNGAAAGTLNANGAGTLTLNGNNGYTGGTVISGGGVVKINSNTSLGAVGGTATINAGTLETTADITTARAFSLGSSSSAISADAATTYTIGGTVNDGAAAGTLNASGAGTVVLNGNNGYTGGTVISGGGTVQINTATSLGAVGGNATINGGTLHVAPATAQTLTTARNFVIGTAASNIINIDGGSTYAVSGTVNSSGGSNVLTKSGSGTLALSGATSTGTLGLNVTAGTLNLAHTVSAGSHLLSNDLASLTLATATKVALTQTGMVAQTEGLSLTGTATFDLFENALVVNNTSYSTVRALVASGYNGGNWNGSGLITSAANDPAHDPNHIKALGIVSNSATLDASATPGSGLFNNSTSLFAPDLTAGGVGVSDSSILVRYTYYGDTNLDGVVDGLDYQAIDAAFAKLNDASGANDPTVSWQTGDFNYDGLIDGNDYGLIDAALASEGSSPLSAGGGGSGPSNVPEPASALLLGFGGLLLGLGRRRRG